MVKSTTNYKLVKFITKLEIGQIRNQLYWLVNFMNSLTNYIWAFVTIVRNIFTNCLWSFRENFGFTPVGNRQCKDPCTKKPSCVWLDNSSIELRIYIYSIRRIHYQWMFLPEEISQFIPWRNTMMVYSQLYRSVAVLRAQCKPGSDITCFEAIFFILSIMMSLYSKQNCNNHRDEEWNNSSYIRKDSVILRWDACYTFCVDKALLTCNIYFVSPSCISNTCSSLYIFEFRATVFEIKRWCSHIARFYLNGKNYKR